MRLFASVFVPENIALQIYKFSEPVSDFFYSKPVKPENMHITLNFFGGEDEKKCSGIIENAVKGIKSFEIVIKGIGYFSYGKYASVLFAGVKDDKGVLTDLAAKTFNRKKEFIPHITLARFKNDIAENGILENKLAETPVKEKDFGSFFVEKVSLVESLLLPEGAKYRILKDFWL